MFSQLLSQCQRFVFFIKFFCLSPIYSNDVVDRSLQASNWALTVSKCKNKSKTKEEECRDQRSRIEWGNEQKHILSAIPQGKSVFITGSAGTGKTLLLEEIIKLLKKLYSPPCGTNLMIGIIFTSFPLP